MAMVKFFENGIDPDTFRKCQLRDIIDIMDLKGAIGFKQQREIEIQDAINSLK